MFINFIYYNVVELERTNDVFHEVIHKSSLKQEEANDYLDALKNLNAHKQFYISITVNLPIQTELFFHYSPEKVV